MRRRSCAYRNRAAGASDRSGHHIGASYGLIASRFERRTERAYTIGQCAVSRQRRSAIGAGKVNVSGITGGRVIELIQRRHGEAES